MDLLDEEGRLFGKINFVDAVTVLVAIGVVVAGSVLFLSEYRTQPQEEVITVQAQADQVATYVANSTDTGPVSGNDNIISVLKKSTDQPTTTANGTVTNITLQVRLRASNDEGELYIANDRIYVGSRITLDLGEVVLDGTVTNITVDDRKNR